MKCTNLLVLLFPFPLFALHLSMFPDNRTNPDFESYASIAANAGVLQMFLIAMIKQSCWSMVMMSQSNQTISIFSKRPVLLKTTQHFCSIRDWSGFIFSWLKVRKSGVTLVLFGYACQQFASLVHPLNEKHVDVSITS